MAEHDALVKIADQLKALGMVDMALKIRTVAEQVRRIERALDEIVDDAMTDDCAARSSVDVVWLYPWWNRPEYQQEAKP